MSVKIIEDFDKAIELVTSKCSGCLAARNAPSKVQIHPWEPSTTPWERIHLDFATTKDGKFLMCVDSYSKWIEVIDMKNNTKAPSPGDPIA